MHQLAPALPDFLTRYPEIEVELAITDRIVDPVADHADVTVRAGRIADTSMTALRSRSSSGRSVPHLPTSPGMAYRARPPT